MRHPHAFRGLMGLAAASVSALSACAQLATVRECDRVIKLVNPSLAEIATLANASGEQGAPPASASPTNSAPGQPHQPETDDPSAPQVAQARRDRVHPDYALLAQRYEDLAGELAELDLKHPPLTIAVKNYLSLLEGTARELHQLDERAKQGVEGKPKPTDPHRALEKIVGREKSLVDQINRACQPS